jgi:hypothetical protein
VKRGEFLLWREGREKGGRGRRKAEEGRVERVERVKVKVEESTEFQNPPAIAIIIKGK